MYLFIYFNYNTYSIWGIKYEQIQSNIHPIQENATLSTHLSLVSIFQIKVPTLNLYKQYQMLRTYCYLLIFYLQQKSLIIQKYQLSIIFTVVITNLRIEKKTL